MTKTTTTSESNIEETVVRLEQLFAELNTYGMTGRSSSVWPAIIKDNFHRQSMSYEYEYPRAFFINLQLQQRILIPYELTKAKSSRLTFVKMIIDKHMSGEIDIFTYHFGMFLVYRDIRHREKEDFSGTSIGKKRAQFVKTLPVSRFMSTDDFITAIWSYQIEYRETDTEEYQRNPFLEKVRILFTNEQFASWTGIYYSEDVTWVEPISYKLNLECRKWSEERDPMAPIKIPEELGRGAYHHRRYRKRLQALCLRRSDSRWKRHTGQVRQRLDCRAL